MEPATSLAALTLAVFTALSQAFSAGTTAYEQGQYKEALTCFTTVVTTNTVPHPLYESALYWRARTYAELEDKPHAEEDLTALLKANPTGPLAALAKKDYEAIAGEPWDHLDLTSPQSAWGSLVAGVMARDRDRVIACCTGKMKREFDHLPLAEGDDWDEVIREISNMTGLPPILNKQKDKAMLGLMRQNGRSTQKMLLERIDGKWLISGPYRADQHGDFEGEGSDGEKKVQKDIELSPEEQAQVAALIRQLGAKTHKMRRAAYDALKVLGPKAEAQLKPAAEDPDPEISFRAKELLSLL